MRVRGEFWGERLATNREATIPHGLSQLEASGALGNFANTARHIGRYVGGLDDSGLTFPFRDTDVYKWLEAVGWELAREDDLELSASAAKVVELVRTAQREDGYLGTFVQLSAREPYADLRWGHELFNVGHLLQAAVAWQQGSGDDSLMAVVAHAVDHIDATLGKGRREGVDGHRDREGACGGLPHDQGGALSGSGAAAP